jgi:hypothetical protein
LRPFLVNLKQAPLYISKVVGYTNQADLLSTVISGGRSLAQIARQRQVSYGKA